MKIREAVPADAPGIARVHVNAWRTTYKGALPDAYLASLSYSDRQNMWERVLGNQSDEHVAYVADDDGRIVGFSWGGPARNAPDYEGELYAIYLLQEYQGDGWGRELFLSVVKGLRAQGMRSMLIWAFTSNEKGRAFYEKMGGVEVTRKMFELGGVTNEEIGYGWPDLTAIDLNAGRRREEPGTQSNVLLSSIDNYIESLFSSNDEALDTAHRSIAENDMPPINVSANEGRLLYILAKMCHAKKILEIGTLSGYSTIWLARALPENGKLITLEFEQKHAEVSRANIEHAGLSDRVEVRQGAGLDLLPQIAEKGEGPFDLFFIDADKVSYPDYLDWAIKLSHPGSVILSDNLVRGGSVISPSPDDNVASVISRYNRTLATNPRLESIILPLVRESVDGIGISIVE